MSWLLIILFGIALAEGPFCPSAEDLVIAYGAPELHEGGWTIRGGGGVATKAAFNLLGGYVEYDVDFSKTNAGVNANIYSIAPSVPPTGFTQQNYCDGAKTGANWCLEVDWVETNGGCGGATALHTVEGPGNGCTAWGCKFDYMYFGNNKYHMRVDYALDGTFRTTINDRTYAFDDLKPTPTPYDKRVLVDAHETKGALIYSSQWVGWVPLAQCGENGDLDTSIASISNLKIYGRVMQGPTPKLCSTGPMPTPTPDPTPKSWKCQKCIFMQ